MSTLANHKSVVTLLPWRLDYEENSVFLFCNLHSRKLSMQDSLLYTKNHLSRRYLPHEKVQALGGFFVFLKSFLQTPQREMKWWNILSKNICLAINSMITIVSWCRVPSVHEFYSLWEYLSLFFLEGLIFCRTIYWNLPLQELKSILGLHYFVDTLLFSL